MLSIDNNTKGSVEGKKFVLVTPEELTNRMIGLSLEDAKGSLSLASTRLEGTDGIVLEHIPSDPWDIFTFNTDTGIQKISSITMKPCLDSN